MDYKESFEAIDSNLDYIIAHKVMLTKFQDDPVVKGIISATKAKLAEYKEMDYSIAALDTTKIEDGIESIDMLVNSLSEYLDTHGASTLEDM